jgi:hypothetical protein
LLFGAWLLLLIVILNLFQDPRSIEKDTARILGVKCGAAGIPDQVRNDGEGISHMTPQAVDREP